MAKTRRHFTHETIFNGKRWSRHLTLELAQKEVKRACSRFDWSPEGFEIRELKRA